MSCKVVLGEELFLRTEGAEIMEEVEISPDMTNWAHRETVSPFCKVLGSATNPGADATNAESLVTSPITKSAKMKMSKPSRGTNNP